MIKKSVRSPIFRGNRKETKININTNKRKKKNIIIYLKSRYSYHYKNGNWDKAKKYNEKSMEMYNLDLRDWFETKQNRKESNLTQFGFEKTKKIKYG